MILISSSLYSLNGRREKSMVNVEMSLRSWGVWPAIRRLHCSLRLGKYCSVLFLGRRLFVNLLLNSSPHRINLEVLGLQQISHSHCLECSLVVEGNVGIYSFVNAFGFVTELFVYFECIE